MVIAMWTQASSFLFNRPKTGPRTINSTSSLQVRVASRFIKHLCIGFIWGRSEKRDGNVKERNTHILISDQGILSNSLLN